jgi:hypothetical protein
MSKTLLGARSSIDRFIAEAEECAKQKMGFAAMSTVFAVMLSVSEAIGKHSGTLTSYDDKSLFDNFVPKIADKTWLMSRSPTTVLSDENIATELSKIRDGLAHQMSLPDYVGMVNTKSEAKEFLKVNPTTSRIISVVEFIEAVKATVDAMVKDYPDAALDSNPRGTPRSPATRVVLPSGASGSPAGSGGKTYKTYRA